MKIGRHQKFNGVDYECRLCERHFVSRGAIYAHCRNTSQHKWCEKCRRVFVSERAKNQHLRYSQRHNICWICPDRRDFETPQDLKDHLLQVHHYCHPCDQAHDSPFELREHDVAVHHLCVECDRYFGNKNELRMHEQTHQPRDVECYGCDKDFKSFSGVLIHLESGTCASGTNEQSINYIARNNCLGAEFTIDNSKGGGWAYFCPECERQFGKLSGLYQHAEDVPDCFYLAQADGYLARLRRLILNRIGRRVGVGVYGFSIAADL